MPPDPAVAVTVEYDTPSGDSIETVTLSPVAKPVAENLNEKMSQPQGVNLKIVLAPPDEVAVTRWGSIGPHRDHSTGHFGGMPCGLYPVLSSISLVNVGVQKED